MTTEKKSKTSFNVALSLIESEVKKRPKNPSIYRVLGLLYAGFGRKEDVLHEGRLTTEICAVSIDVYSGVI